MSNQVISETKEGFKKSLDHLQEEYSKLQIGRASGALVEDVLVEAYGSKQPLKSLANVSIPDPKTIQIQPWDKTVLNDVEKAIREADLNLNPINDGSIVRINIPPLTEERRTELAKLVHKMAEETKISIRHARQKAHDQFKQSEKDKEITEDEARNYQKRLQDIVDDFNKEVDTLAKNKESDVMTV